LFEIIAFFYVIRIYIKYKPEIFHIHTLPDFLVFAALIPKLYGSKIILDFHELFPEAIMQFNKEITVKSFWYKMILFLENISFNFADEIIVFHDPAKDILINRYGNKKVIITIMNGVDENEIMGFERKKNGKFIIVYNGTINYNLNLSLVIKALALIKTANPDIYNMIEFHLYGDGPDLKNILNIAKKLSIENVSYKGRVEFCEMMKKLETASLCVLPPLKDVYSDLFYSLKLIEMIYLKIPVAATRLNTYMKYYPENCLLYFDSNDEEGLAENILFAYNYPDKVLGYTENAFCEYQKYSWEIMRERYIKLVEKILNHKY
jgi:glycosyltransferase involved in cell wall biosynthesis